MVLIPEFPQRFVKWRQNTVISEECEVAELTVRSCPLAKTLLTPGAKWRGIGLHVHVLHGILILPFQKKMWHFRQKQAVHSLRNHGKPSAVCVCVDVYIKFCMHRNVCVNVCMCMLCVYLCIYVSMYLCIYVM